MRALAYHTLGIMNSEIFYALLSLKDGRSAVCRGLGRPDELWPLDGSQPCRSGLAYRGKGEDMPWRKVLWRIKGMARLSRRKLPRTLAPFVVEGRPL